MFKRFFSLFTFKTREDTIDTLMLSLSLLMTSVILYMKVVETFM